MKKLKIFALVSFIVMCLSITFVSLSVGTSTPTKAATVYVHGDNIYYETISVAGHTILIARLGNDIEVCRVY